MAIIELKGKLHRVGEVQTFSSGFRKREIVIDTGGKYDRFFPVELKQDQCDEDFIINTEVALECYVNGSREGYMDKNGNERFFLSLGMKDYTITKESNESAEPAGEVPF